MKPHPARHRSRLALLAVSLSAFAVVTAGCIVSMEPQEATNEVGTEHTVTVTLRDPETIVDAFIPILSTPPAGVAASADSAMESLESQAEALQDDREEEEPGFALFEVIDGPNEGESSDDDSECVPKCFLAEDEFVPEISWTYQSNGEPGTDTILFCFFPPEIFDGTEEEIEELTGMSPEEVLAFLSEEFEDDFSEPEDLLCQTSTKTWVEPEPTPEPQQPPNIGQALGAILGGTRPQPTAQPQPTTVPGGATGPIRPPSTGDGGLR